MPADRKYTIARPIQEVRLRKWSPGNVAQFKRVVENLESELNTAMAAQVAQGAKRIISLKVPQVTGLAVRAGFKNFQLTFNQAKGIKNLLFYEIQKSTAVTFTDDVTTTYTVPQTSLTIPARTELQENHFRVRVVNAKFEVGVWSSIVAVTSRSFFRLGVFQTGNLSDSRSSYTDADADGFGDATVTDIAPAAFNTWVTVFTTTYSPSAADVSFQVHAGVQASCINHFTAGNGVVSQITNDASVIFRVTRDGTPYKERLNVRAWGYQQRSGAVPSVFKRKEFMVFGTLVLGFESYDGTESNTPYVVQAKVLSETCSSDDTSGVLVARTYDDNVRIIVSSTTLFEVIQT